MQPPAVRTLDQLVSSSNAAYDPSRASINSQIQDAQNSGQAQEQGLNAAKDTAFGDITQTAVRRGALFSGFTPDQQAHYVGEKYLPALANLRASNNQVVQGLNSNLNSLNMDQQKTAQATQNQDISQLYDYNKTQQDHQWQTEAASTAYQQELSKLRLSAQLSAQASASSGPSATDIYRGDAAAVDKNLNAMMGGDNYVSPTIYAQQKAAFVRQGHSATQFDSEFAGYRNPKNKSYKLG